MDSRPPFHAPGYRPDIDGLRGIAVLAVVVYHAAPALLPGGFVGVDVFFVISGFLITNIIQDGLERGAFSLHTFYARRIRRLFPALSLVLASALAIGWFTLLADEYSHLGRHVAAGAAFLSNFALWQEAGYFDQAAATKPLLHLWSLGIEEQFYLAWPLLAMLLLPHRRLALIALPLLAAASFAWSLHLSATAPDAAFYSPLSRAWELLAGAMLGVATRTAVGLSPAPQRLAALRPVAGVTGAALLAAGLAWIRPGTPFPGLAALLPVTGTVLLIVAGTGGRSASARLLAWRPLVAAGLVSYPLYLWHWLLISFLHIEYQRDPPAQLLALAVAVSIVLAAITYVAIERRVRYRRGTVAPALVILVLAVGMAGWFVHARGGLGERLGSNIAMGAEQIAAERNAYWNRPHAYRYAESRTRILVFGDSQGQDMYRALAHVPGLGLYVVATDPACAAFDAAKKMYESSAAACAAAFEQLLATPELAAATHLLYAPTWTHEIEPDDHHARYPQNAQRIRAVNPGIRIVLAGPKPLLGPLWLTIDQILRDLTTFSAVEPHLQSISIVQQAELAHARAIAGRIGAHVLDTSAVFCTPAPCPFYVDNRFTYFDQNHWTAFGAEMFAARLQASPQIALFAAPGLDQIPP